MLTIEFYVTKSLRRKEKWKWRAVAANGRIIAKSSEGYASEDNCREGFNVLKHGIMAPSGYRTRTL